LADIGGSIVCHFGNMSNEGSQISFFRLLAQVAPEKWLYFVPEFIAFSVLPFIFFQKESCVDVNVSDTSSGEDNLSF